MLFIVVFFEVPVKGMVVMRLKEVFGYHFQGLLFTLLLGSEFCFAGGILIPKAGGEDNPTTVDMDRQMGVVVINSDNRIFDLYIRASFTGNPQEFAWVIPFPHKVFYDPAEVDDRFFQDLDSYTRIVFFTDDCYRECPAGGCISDVADGEVEVENGDVTYEKVEMWENGSVGTIENYKLLSTLEGSSVTEYLVQNQFVVRDSLRLVLEELEKEGYYFFVAEVVNNYGLSGYMPVVHFVVALNSLPFYPLMLDGLSGAQRLSIVIWVVDKQGWLPSNYCWDYLAGEGELFDELSMDEYHSMLESIMDENSRSCFLVQYSSSSMQSIFRRDCVFHDHLVSQSYSIDGEDGSGLCHFSFNSGEMKSIKSDYLNKGGSITRFYAQIPPDGITADIVFRVDATHKLRWVNSWFWKSCNSSVKEKCQCFISTYGEGGKGGGVGLYITFVILSVVFFILKRRRGI